MSGTPGSTRPLHVASTWPEAKAERPLLLIVDDDAALHKVLKIALGEERFRFQDALDGEEAWRKLRGSVPDLILCDYEMQGINGHELVRRLRRDVRLAHVPVILLTGHGSVEAIVAGLEAGADDYVRKPFDPDELCVRVLAQLRRRDRDLRADAISGFPSGEAIPHELARRITAGLPFGAAYADLDHFKPYVERYGFLRAGRVVRRTSEILYESFRREAGEEVFVGHIAGDDFFAVCIAGNAEAACRAFLTQFAETVPEFYEPADAERGFYEGYDREGVVQRYPLLSASVCLVDSREHKLRTPEDVVRLAFGARARVKAIAGSALVRV